ncbi:hypothetical protein CEXT_446561 [Caerostris extrusa]|uniref:Uncharacterized protein n=1 Tax=Caerostris extrusa TaxID=172846 RepID=A0AAV4STJ6_CAEEX|nr:hypothetical protein CEXT_446561 [Caerostris extrusa]
MIISHNIPTDFHPLHWVPIFITSKLTCYPLHLMIIFITVHPLHRVRYLITSKLTCHPLHLMIMSHNIPTDLSSTSPGSISRNSILRLHIMLISHKIPNRPFIHFHMAMIFITYQPFVIHFDDNIIETSSNLIPNIHPLHRVRYLITSKLTCHPLHLMIMSHKQ